jgi:glycerate kinase
MLKTDIFSDGAMKIIIAIDSFKGTLSSVQAGNAVKKGIKLFMQEANSHTEIFPMADGGEGTLKAVLAFDKNARLHKTTVKDSLMRDRVIPFIIIKRNGAVSAVIEMASIAGLTQLECHERDIMKATTYGVGQCIKKALDFGADTVYLGIGGSATNDAGIGMLQALGAEFLDAGNNNIQTGAEQIGNIKTINLSNFDKRIKNTKFISVCDVKNPFYGPFGATEVYGPQKGASDAQVKLIDNMFKEFARIVSHQTGIDIQNIKGSGAGGGIGGGAAVFLNSEFKTGADWLIEYSNIESSILNADLIITGEGRTDEQTFNDKLPLRIGLLCKKHAKKAVVISGSRTISKDGMREYGVESVYALTDYFGADEAISNAGVCLTEATRKIFEELFENEV